VVATIFQLSRDLRDTYSQLFEKGPRRFSFNDFVAFVAIALKERVSLVWLEMISKPMMPAEHQQLRKSIESFLKKLDTLLAKLDQPPTDLA
jgi:hypothetical protein